MLHVKRILQTILFNLVIGIYSWASPVNVSTNGYSGEWSIVNQTEILNGDQTLDLPAGAYQVKIGGIGFFNIEVLASGEVQALNSSAVGGQNELSFSTQSLFVDPNGFSGQWAVLGINSFSNVAQSLTLVTDVRYRFAAGAIGIIDSSFNSNGLLIADNGVSFSSTANSTQFNIAPLNIEPQLYAGSWTIPFVTPGRITGASQLQLVKGARYQMGIAISSFTFLFNDDESVTVQNSLAALGDFNTLTFQNQQISINANGFTGNWVISQATPILNGNQSLTLVPDIDYIIFVGGGNLANFRIGINGAINIIDSTSASADGSELSFNTYRLLINPENFNGLVSIIGVTPDEPIYEATGPGEVVLINDLTYALLINGSPASIDLSDNCIVNPESIEVEPGSSVNFSCETIEEPQEPTITEQCLNEYSSKSKFLFILCVKHKLKKAIYNNELTHSEASALFKEIITNIKRRVIKYKYYKYRRYTRHRSYRRHYRY